MMASLGAPNSILYLQERLLPIQVGFWKEHRMPFWTPFKLARIQPTAWSYLGLHGDILSPL